MKKAVVMSGQGNQTSEKENRNGQNLTFYLTSSPYSYQDGVSTIRMTEAALNKGHTVNIIASADGLYCFLSKQKAKGILNAEAEFSRLIDKGLNVYL